MNIRVLFVILGSLVISPVIAFQNEPDGFRGIKWGSDFSAHEKEMSLAEKGKSENYYLRKNDKMAIGGAELKYLVYGYWKGKFTSVFMLTTGASNKSALIRAFQTQFGSGVKPNQFLDEYVWRGAATSISLKCDAIGEKCQVFLFSTELLAKQNEENKKAAEKASGDF